MAKMHADEIEINEALVRKLIDTQFPQWADLDLVAVPSAGTDNALFRLGNTLAVRLPRLPRTATQIEKEQRWLPILAPQLPLEIPVPLEKGQPDENYPNVWSVYTWLEGENATLERITDLVQAAHDLAAFLKALQAIDTTDAPRPGEHNFGRGVPLAERDAATRQGIEDLRQLNMIDVDAALALWEKALQTPVWEHDPVWIHGDIQAGNLLARNGRLSAVIDFGGLGVGDPAVDLMMAWYYFSGESREAFREALQPDQATWERGRGWALSFAVIALPYYYQTNPVLSDIARLAISEVLVEGNPPNL